MAAKYDCSRRTAGSPSPPFFFLRFSPQYPPPPSSSSSQSAAPALLLHPFLSSTSTVPSTGPCRPGFGPGDTDPLITKIGLSGSGKKACSHAFFFFGGMDKLLH